MSATLVSPVATIPGGSPSVSEGGGLTPAAAPQPRCPGCTTPVPRTDGPGRPARWCSARCRKLARYRALAELGRRHPAEFARLLTLVDPSDPSGRTTS